MILWTIEVKELHNKDKNSTSTYSDSGVENDLLRTGVVFSSSFLPVGVYAIVLPAFVQNQEEAILSYIADVLRKHDNFTMVVTKDNSINSSKTAGEEDS